MANKNLSLSWPALAVTAAIVVAIVSGAIQLGSVQTYVLINTGLLKAHADRELILLERMSKLEAKVFEMDRRVGTIDTHDLATRDNEAKILERLSRVEVRIGESK